MADSKTLVEIVEKSYCTAFSDILWEKKHGSREQVTESVFVCIPHLQGPREECKSPLCASARGAVAAAAATIERVSERARVQHSVLKGKAFPLVFFAIRVPNEIPNRNPQSQSGSRFALYWEPGFPQMRSQCSRC
jgi:hypothetical protein